jgi:hypothetical protein
MEPSASLKRRWRSLLASSLETVFHQLLYNRHVYPRDTFDFARFLGVRCRVNRHPGVVRYIQDSVKVAVPSVLSGVATEVLLIICETDKSGASTRELETYRLCLSGPYVFSSDPGDEDEIDDDAEDDGRIESLEGSMRSLLLQVLGLPSNIPSHSDSLSFRIMVHVPRQDASCPELNDAFSEGSWISNNVTRDDKMVLIHPIYQSSTAFGDLTFQQQFLDESGNQRLPPLTAAADTIQTGEP